MYFLTIFVPSAGCPDCETSSGKMIKNNKTEITLAINCEEISRKIVGTLEKFGHGILNIADSQTFNLENVHVNSLLTAVLFSQCFFYLYFLKC